eukprot:g5632.t1
MASGKSSCPFPILWRKEEAPGGIPTLKSLGGGGTQRAAPVTNTMVWMLPTRTGDGALTMALCMRHCRRNQLQRALPLAPACTLRAGPAVMEWPAGFARRRAIDKKAAASAAPPSLRSRSRAPSSPHPPQPRHAVNPSRWLETTLRLRDRLKSQASVNVSPQKAHEEFLLCFQQMSAEDWKQLTEDEDNFPRVLDLLASSSLQESHLPSLVNQAMACSAQAVFKGLSKFYALQLMRKDKAHALQVLTQLFTRCSASRHEVLANLPFLKEHTEATTTSSPSSSSSRSIPQLLAILPFLKEHTEATTTSSPSSSFSRSLPQLLAGLQGLCEDFSRQEAKRSRDRLLARDNKQENLGKVTMARKIFARWHDREVKLKSNQTARGYRSDLELLETQAFNSTCEVRMSPFGRVWKSTPRWLCGKWECLPGRGWLRWEYSKKLMYGSLVCLSCEDFKTEPLWATVAQRELAQLTGKRGNQKGLFMAPDGRPLIALKPIKGDEKEIWTHLGEGRTAYKMYESTSAFFLPYNAVISSMQALAREKPADGRLLPFRAQLVDLEPNVPAPAYLAKISDYKLPCVKHPAHPLGMASFDITKPWPTELDSSLDTSQLAALRQILTKQVALVQGPPGTGKTFVSLKALQTLLANLPEDYTIYLLAYPNHALDQLVRGVLAFEENVVRVGGRSEDETLEPYNLFNARRRASLSRSMRYTLNNLKLKRNDLAAEVECIKKKFGVVSLESLWRCTSMSPAQAASLFRGCQRKVLRPHILISPKIFEEDEVDDFGSEWQQQQSRRRRQGQSLPCPLHFWLTQTDLRVSSSETKRSSKRNW